MVPGACFLPASNKSPQHPLEAAEAPLAGTVSASPTYCFNMENSFLRKKIPFPVPPRIKHVQQGHWV